MHAKKPVLDHGGNREKIEAFRKGFPKLNRVSSFALLIKAVNSVNRIGLVISSQDEKVERIFDFISEKETNGLQVLFTAINIVSQKEIVLLRRITSALKKS
jgi:hypothetical protein